MFARIVECVSKPFALLGKLIHPLFVKFARVVRPNVLFLSSMPKVVLESLQVEIMAGVLGVPVVLVHLVIAINLSYQCS
jgi:hypothetical protein